MRGIQKAKIKASCWAREVANEFNEVVCMDLKEYIHNKIWILHGLELQHGRANQEYGSVGENVSEHEEDELEREEIGFENERSFVGARRNHAEAWHSWRNCIRKQRRVGA